MAELKVAGDGIIEKEDSGHIPGFYTSVLHEIPWKNHVNTNTYFSININSQLHPKYSLLFYH